MTSARRAESKTPERSPAPHAAPAPSHHLAQEALQTDLLAHVSRTFALTIPELPPALRDAVTNAYLLCRIVDTIEDESGLSVPDKRSLCTQFAAVVAGDTSAEAFAEELTPRLSASTPPAEHRLIRETPQVIAVTRSLRAEQQDALRACVQVMADGMAAFQEGRTGCGLADLAELDRYCYCVAGVVGEMLTRLFCDYSPQIDRHRETLMPLAVSFGQGLQMTNILKDIWEDRQRGACWLPQDVFRESGFDLADLVPGASAAGFDQAMERLVGIAHAHLKDALRYTLLIPRNEIHIRHFCLWAIGMALLTLRKIKGNPGFSRGAQVKISRRSVKLVIIASRLCVRSDALLNALFSLAGLGLPFAAGGTRRGTDIPMAHAPR